MAYFELLKPLGNYKTGHKFDSFDGIVSGVDDISFLNKGYFRMVEEKKKKNKSNTSIKKKEYKDHLKITVSTDFNDPLGLFDETLDEWQFPKRPVAVRRLNTNEVEIIKSDYDLASWFGLNDGSLNKFIFSPIR